MAIVDDRDVPKKLGWMGGFGIDWSSWNQRRPSRKMTPDSFQPGPLREIWRLNFPSLFRIG
jgi:hypothetical protein